MSILLEDTWHIIQTTSNYYYHLFAPVLHISWQLFLTINYEEYSDFVDSTAPVDSRGFSSNLWWRLFYHSALCWKMGHSRNTVWTTPQIGQFLGFCSLNNVKLFQPCPCSRFREQPSLLPERKHITFSNVYYLYTF